MFLTGLAQKHDSPFLCRRRPLPPFLPQMFSQPADAASSSAGIQVTPSASLSSRSSRLRGFNYLRSHSLLNRESSSANAGGSPPPQPVGSARCPPPSVVRVALASTSVTAPSASSAPDATQPPAALRVPAPTGKNSPETTPPDGLDMTRTRSATDAGHGLDSLPSIRFSTFYDPRATRPSLTFTPVSRTLPTGHEVIRVGRYSERDNQPTVPSNLPSAAPLGFKSKVVSRRHCEFWCEGGKWYIKDVKSSSGTFLNHIRLSPPGTESKPFPVNDGDIVQLGIDFKGGEEMIFRCVKMRLELNRGWQNKLNTFK